MGKVLFGSGSTDRLAVVLGHPNLEVTTWRWDQWWVSPGGNLKKQADLEMESQTSQGPKEEMQNGVRRSKHGSKTSRRAWKRGVRDPDSLPSSLLHLAVSPRDRPSGSAPGSRAGRRCSGPEKQSRTGKRQEQLPSAWLMRSKIATHHN